MDKPQSSPDKPVRATYEGMIPTPFSCYRCGSVFSATIVAADHDQPDDGDFAVCGQCNTVYEYVQDGLLLELRPMTDEALRALDAETRDALLSFKYEMAAEQEMSRLSYPADPRFLPN